MFANKNGVYGVFGATVQKISDDLDGIFQLTDFSVALSAALNDFHIGLTGGGSIHCYLLLLKYLDPVQGPRSIVCVFQHNKWFVVSQGDNLIALCSIPLSTTTQFEAFGSSGSDITQLLQDATAAVSVLLQTSLTNHGSPVTAKIPVRAGVSVTARTPQNFTMKIVTENGSNSYALGVSIPVVWVNNLGQTVQFRNNSLQNVNFSVGGFQFPYKSVEGYGKVLGMDVLGSVTGFAINGASIEYNDMDNWGALP
jgi:hypothetical protein